MSSVNHQFRLARFAETFASASRTLSGWVRVSSRSPTPNRSGERRSSGKPPLSDHDQWPLCANSGHTPTSRRMGQIDPLLPFPIDPGTGEEHQKATVAATSRTRQDRPLGMQRPNASVRLLKFPCATSRRTTSGTSGTSRPSLAVRRTPPRQEVRLFQLQMAKDGVGAPTNNAAVAASGSASDTAGALMP